MNKKCIGCGFQLQSTNKDKEGYIREDKIQSSTYCERCFKTIHYGSVKTLEKRFNKEDIIKKGRTYLYVIDSLTISKKVLDEIKDIDDVYIVLTKRDLLPKSVKDSKLIKYITDRYNVKGVYIISSKNKYNIDYLFNDLVKRNIKKIYVVGYTNAGKSSLINAILNANNIEGKLTVSKYMNTTLDNIEINLGGIVLVDTPGLTNNDSFLNDIDAKKYPINSEIKPRIQLLKKGFMILIDDIIRIENNSEDVKLVFYISNNIKLQKMKIIKRDNNFKYKTNINISNEEDITLEGIGFIKVVNYGKLDIFTNTKNTINKRDKLV